MKRTIDLVAEPGDRVEVRVKRGRIPVWAPALMLWAETTWESDGKTTRYMVSLDPESIHGTPAWRVEPEIRKPQQP
jgi:hypothetical protein